MPKPTKSRRIDPHTLAAARVSNYSYFVVNDVSGNENPGLLVGTEVQKYGEPEARDSKYWNGLYWTVLVICPNGETRRVCCDVLIPRRTDRYFKRQRKIFPQVNA